MKSSSLQGFLRRLPQAGRAIACLVVITASVPLTRVDAQTTWSNNNATNNWTNPATWSSGVPTSATTAVLTATSSVLQVGSGTVAEAASIAMSNAAGNQTIDILNGGRLAVAGAITDPGAGAARIFVANTNVADATNRLTSTAVTVNNFTLRNPGSQTNYLTTDFNITAAVQVLVGEFGSGGGASFAQNGGVINADNTGFGITIGEGLSTTNVVSPLSYDLNAGSIEALRIGAGNGNGTGASGANRFLNASAYNFNFNAGTVQNRGSNTTLNIQNGFGNSGTATNTMGWNTASPLLVRLSSSGSNVFNANGASSVILVAPSARLVDQTSGGTIAKVGAGAMLLAGGNTANSNTWSGPTTVSNGTFGVDYNRIAGQAATGGTDSLANAYNPVSQLILAGGAFSLTGRGSAAAGSLTNVTLTNNSTQVTVITTNGLAIGQAVTNANLPAGTYIRRLVSATVVELSTFPTNNASAQTLELGVADFANSQTINDVVLSATNSTITVTPGSGSATTLLTFSNFSGTGGITKAGSGTLLLAPGAGITNTLTGNLTGSGGTVAKGGAGRVILATTNPAGSSYSGAIAVNEGTLQVGNTTTANDSAQRLTAASGATVASGASLLYKNSTALPTGSPLTVAGLLVTDTTGVTNGGFFNTLGALTLSNGGELRANAGANTNSFQSYALNGAVTVNGTSPATITTAAAATNGDGIHLAVSNTTSSRVFDVANVTGDANPDLTISARLINGSGTLSAVGLTKTGAGQMVLAGSNNYTGSTVVSNGQVELATNGWLRFAIGATGVNNSVSGAGSAFFRGTFLFDLAAAGTNTGDAWTIVSVSTPSYDGAFQVSGFTNSGGTWTRTTNGVTYQFVQATGILSIPGAGPTNAYGQWLTNYPSLTGTNTNAAADPDGDGFANASEFAFGGNPTVGSPALMAAQKAGTNANISFIAATNAVTYVVKSTTNLATGPWNTNSVTITNSPDQSGVLLTNYVRRQFTVPATSNSFYKVEASY